MRSRSRLPRSNRTFTSALDIAQLFSGLLGSAHLSLKSLWKHPATQGSGKALSQRIEPFYVQLQQLQLVFLPLRIQQFCKSTVLTTTSSNLVLLQLRILQSFGDEFKNFNKETAI